jgi:uncharacterized membrane protein
MLAVFRHLRVRPRLVVAITTGCVLGLLLPASMSPLTRALLGWNVAVWLYLVLVGWMMARADHARLQRIAVAQAEGAATVLTMVSVACVVSLLGMVAELSAAKLPGAPHALPHVAFALLTVVGTWLLLPTVFALTYASRYFAVHHASGLQFPDTDPHFKPDYGDFLYFAFTIAVASQTADVSVTSSKMRRLVLAQSLLSFAFNTAILAFTINVAASLF